jgi:endonuclease YncB( thermonuclease family)
VRLHGIDAPEAGQMCLTTEGVPWGCGVAAAIHLREIIGGVMVTCERRGIGKYGRTVATCQADGRNLGTAMVGDGWALAYREYLDASEHNYITLERMAKVSGAGIWSGTFTPPWEWRRERRTPQEQAPGQGA